MSNHTVQYNYCVYWDCNGWVQHLQIGEHVRTAYTQGVKYRLTRFSDCLCTYVYEDTKLIAPMNVILREYGDKK